MTALPDRQFFKIGEAAEIVGVKTHVLRYWETEFPSIRPLKTRGAHRMYRRADVELLCVIHKLLHHEGYTIAGARKRVRELRRAQRAAPSTQTAGETKLSVPLGALGEPSAAQQTAAQEHALTETTHEFSVLTEDAQDPGVLRDAASGLGLLKDEPRQHGLWDEASRELGLRAELIQLRRELSELMHEIDRLALVRAPAPQPSATVTAVVPKTVLIAQRKQLR